MVQPVQPPVDSSSGIDSSDLLLLGALGGGYGCGYGYGGYGYGAPLLTYGLLAEHQRQQQTQQHQQAQLQQQQLALQQQQIALQRQALQQQQAAAQQGGGGGGAPPPYAPAPSPYAPGPGYPQPGPLQPGYPAGYAPRPQPPPTAVFDQGARFDPNKPATLPPPPPGYAPSAAQTAVAQGQTVAARQERSNEFGGSDGGATLF